MNKTKGHTLIIRGVSRKTKNALKKLAKERPRGTMNEECIKAFDVYLESKTKEKTAQA